MTIRQYLRRLSDRYATAAFVLLLAAGILVSYVPGSLIIRIAFGILIAVGVVAGFWSLFEIPCPKCRDSLGLTGFWVAMGGKRYQSPQCPHCGIPVDADMPEAKT